ncbi:MAG: lipid A export permease/ATP-binding protein MsbA [Cellvibrionaceae bacterium]|nr:lipid A export permease/ATP-binding protein MsbA [Cellvibrionaceae bacterium]
MEDRTLSLYPRLLSYAAKYKLCIAVSIVGFALFATMEALLLGTVEFFINAIGDGNSDSKFTHFLPAEFVSSVFFVPVAIVVLSVFRGIGAYYGNFFMSKMGLGVVNDLRKQVFDHLLVLPQSYYDKRNSGELVSLIVYNIEQVTGSLTNAVKIILRDGFSVIGFLSVMFYHNWKLTLVFFSVAPLLAGLIYLSGRYFRRVSRHIQRAVGRVTHIATQSFQGIKLVKSFNAETYEQKRFADAADENLKFATKFERVIALQTPVLHVVIAVSLAAIFLLILMFWEGTPAAAVVYVTAAGAIAKPFRQLSKVNSIIQRGMAAAETIFGNLDLSPEVDSGRQQLSQVKGEIEFRNVSFAYNGNQPVLNDISITLPAGKTVAIVGSSGSGKSTLASLLLRLYEPDSGGIFVDGIPITDVSLNSLRENMSLVNQQTILFNDSVKANVAYTEALERIDCKAIMAAAENAQAKTFIENLEQGFDTQVGEAGDLLSGGQRQRLAIARAFYKNAPILILDEATSALDNESEKQIQIALDVLTKDRTTLVIAHRLSTVEKADLIVVLAEGKIVEQGSHQLLLSKGGAYAQLHQIQSH